MSATGRYWVRTKEGRVFCVEAIDKHVGKKKLWGDMDPASKKMTGDYGSKHPGAIHPDDSIITEENGFKNIVTLPPGTSPNGYIEMLLKDGGEIIKREDYTSSLFFV
jgi:hypothetical protein